MSSGLWDKTAVAEIVAELKDREGALLPILHRIQDRFGYIPPDSIPIIASGLNLSRAEVHGVVSFYRDFRSEPPGVHVIRICRAESCQAMGAASLIDYVKQELKLEFGGTDREGFFTLEPVYCFGNCACSPAVMVDEQIYGRMTPERLESLLRKLRSA